MWYKSNSKKKNLLKKCKSYSYTPIQAFWFSLKNQSFLVPNLLNNQSDFIKFLWRHDFFQDKLDSSYFLKIANEMPDWYIRWILIAPLFKTRVGIENHCIFISWNYLFFKGKIAPRYAYVIIICTCICTGSNPRILFYCQFVKVITILCNSM